MVFKKINTHINIRNSQVRVKLPQPILFFASQVLETRLLVRDLQKSHLTNKSLVSYSICMCWCRETNFKSIMIPISRQRPKLISCQINKMIQTREEKESEKLRDVRWYTPSCRELHSPGHLQPLLSLLLAFLLDGLFPLKER